MNQASAPSRAMASWMRWLTSGSRSGSPVLLSTNMASGVPQARWREISQSGRFSTMARMRVWPLKG